MNPTRSIGLISIMLAASIAAEAGPPQSPTFEQRIEAQRAIERVYYSHLVGQTRTFDEAVPAALIENKVRTYLEQSAALRDVWRTEITPEALRRELERIAAGTRMAERLSEIYAALGNDALLIEECFARPVLVDRLARSFQAGDGILHQHARAEAEVLRARLTDGSLDPSENHPRRSEVVVIERAADADPLEASANRDPGTRELDTEAFAQWRARMPSKVGEVGEIIEEADHLSFGVLLSDEPGSAQVASYIVPKVAWDTWWQAERQRWRAEDYKPVDRVEPPSPPPLPSNATDRADAMAGQTSPGPPSCTLSPTWSNGILDDLPTGRDGHSAVWTGSHMIIWGGYHNDFGVLNTGSRYDPVIDTWSPISTFKAPIARYLHTGVWTGSVMVVWGGYGKPPKGAALRSGGRYNPATDTWQTVSTNNAPVARLLHTAVWTGRHMIVWGGLNSKGQLGSGGKYDPVRNTWSTVTTFRAPTRRVDHTTVWTGTRMIVWGGYAPGAFHNTGASYDPLTNSWTELPVAGAPSTRAIHTAVWTGVEMIVWGGTGPSVYVATGGRYNPNTNTWSAIATQNAPEARGEHLAVWTGSEMLVYGGHATQGSAEFGNGGRYDPSTDTWTAMSTVGAPARRYAPSATWTGERLVVWGGSARLNTGGRYDPRTDSWTPTSTLNAPATLRDHSAFWTGTMMIVWGGHGELGPVQSGSRYDPLTDAWTPLSTDGAPESSDSRILWTGSHMVVWGGGAYTNLNTGAFYEPISDVWRPMSLTGAPSPRRLHAMVWTGDKLLVWGGTDTTFSYLGDGGRYDFATDTWSPITMVGAPSGRRYPVAVWTGSQMIVWGGEDYYVHFAATGARYDPAEDRWYPISTVDAPAARVAGSVVWTGLELLLWGGTAVSGFTYNDGARYDPVNDQWRPMSTIGAPSRRTDHTTIWTGSALLVWGGIDHPSTFLNSGGLYDPVSDTWRLMTLTGAPSARYFSTAVWTGRMMIIWGGQQGYYAGTAWFATGGAYDPTTNSWQKTSLSGAPSPRSNHTAVWTGAEMVVFGGGVSAIENNGGRLAITCGP